MPLCSSGLFFSLSLPKAKLLHANVLRIKILNWKTLLLSMLAATLMACSGKPVSPEKLLANPPNNWRMIYQINNVGTRLTDFIPENDDNINWTAKISFESFQDFADADPIDVTLNQVEDDEELCNFIQHFNLFSGLENNYPTSLRLFMCGESTVTEKGLIKMIKAIKGDDYFYIIRLTKRVEPFEVNQPEIDKEEIAAWSRYFRTINVCNEQALDHSCPGAKTP